MANRASHLLLALLLASACNQQRTSDASAVDGKQNASGESAESDDASQEREDTSHDAPPPDAERAALDPTPATTATVDPRVDAPLREEAIRRALVDLAEWTKKKGGTLGASIVDVRDGRRVAAVEAARPLNPASNQKILTAAAALHYLGPAYRFKTELRGNPKNGVAEVIVLSGNGDPSLSTQDLWRLARVVRERGLKRVGAVYVDQSYFDDQFVPPAFEQQPNEWAAFRAPVSAVAVEQNTVTLNVLPNASGTAASFWFEPPGAVDSHGTIATRAPGSGDAVGWSLRPDDAPGATRLRSEVSGGIAADLGRRRYTRRLEDPRLVPGYALRDVLKDVGIEVGDEVRLGKLPSSEQLAYITSKPLAQLLYPVGKESDNFYAEMLLKVVGAAANADGKATPPATTAAGARALVRWLEGAKIDTKDVVVANGSGLFDANRVSAGVLAEALAAAYREPAISSEMVAQLAIGGVDGTLRNRFRDLAGQRIVRAKTGTLRNVIALSGYVMGPAGRAPIAFSLLVVGVPAEPGEARKRSDRVVTEIAKALWAAPQPQSAPERPSQQEGTSRDAQPSAP